MRTVQELQECLNLKIISGNAKSLNRKIERAEVSRPGLELAGYHDYFEPRRILILGNKEMAVFKTLDDEAKVKNFKFLMNAQTPLIIISRNIQLGDELVLKIAQDNDFPILSYDKSTSSLLIKIIPILNEWFAPTNSMHGTFLQLYGKGVFIQGESGIGKSEIALELLRKGHSLIADDYVEFKRLENSIIGRCAPLIKNMIEIRGLGILDVTRLFGYNCVLDQHSLDYIIKLEKWDNHSSYERFGNMFQTEKILNHEITKLIIPVTEGRSLADVIEVAIINLSLKSSGYDSALEFEKRMTIAMKEGSNK